MLVRLGLRFDLGPQPTIVLNAKRPVTREFFLKFSHGNICESVYEQLLIEKQTLSQKIKISASHSYILSVTGERFTGPFLNLPLHEGRVAQV